MVDTTHAHQMCARYLLALSPQRLHSLSRQLQKLHQLVGFDSLVKRVIVLGGGGESKNNNTLRRGRYFV